MSEARGLPVGITVFVDANHGGNKTNQRIQTGVLIFLNKASIHWFSKRQPSVATSTFGAGFCAIKVAVEMTESLR